MNKKIEDLMKRDSDEKIGSTPLWSPAEPDDDKQKTDNVDDERNVGASESVGNGGNTVNTGTGFVMMEGENSKNTGNQESSQKPNQEPPQGAAFGNRYGEQPAARPQGPAMGETKSGSTTSGPTTEKLEPDKDIFEQLSEEQKFDTNYDAEPTLKKNKKKNSGRKIIALVLVVVLAMGAGFGGGMLASSTNDSQSSGSDTTINAKGDISVTEAVAEKVSPSVVGITSTQAQAQTSPYDDIFGYGEGSEGGGSGQETGGVGTGIIVDKAGYILTNSHVVLDGEVDKITVHLDDSREFEGELLWYDASIDLAIVKIEASNLVAADLGNSDDVNIGSYVAAIGNPYGLEFSGSVTQGVVSGKDRTITASSGTKTVEMENLIQVDAAINSGNSGGPLLNAKGEVIGVNTAKASGEGMGFAIPINTAKPIIEQIKETGTFNRVYLGVTVGNVSDLLEEYDHIDLGTETGAYIQQVSNNSPAQKGGLKVKDVIVEVEGTKIEKRTDLVNLLLNYAAGDTLEVKYIRNGKAKTTKVKLTSDDLT